MGEQIFRLTKPEKRRNTLCISSFSGKVRRKRCRQDVRGDLFSVSLADVHAYGAVLSGCGDHEGFMVCKHVCTLLLKAVDVAIFHRRARVLCFS